MKKDNLPVMYTVPEAMAILKLSRSGLYTLFRTKKLRRIKLLGKTFVRKDDLEELLESIAI